MIKDYNYIYLHGFTSSPSSKKALFFKNKIEELGGKIIIPDLNLPEFKKLTISRQLQQVKKIIQANKEKPIILIGSSLGGLTAAKLIQLTEVKALLLMAPAFGIKHVIQKTYGKRHILLWRILRNIRVPHISYNKKCSLNYKFYKDLQAYSDLNINLSKPCTIIHGVNDSVIPIKNSRVVARVNNQVELIEVNSDHGLEDQLNLIWDKFNQLII